MIYAMHQILVTTANIHGCIDSNISIHLLKLPPLEKVLPNVNLTPTDLFQVLLGHLTNCFIKGTVGSSASIELVFALKVSLI